MRKVFCTLPIVSYPLSLACTSAPCCSRYSTTDTLLYPAAKWSGVDWRPSMSLQLTLWTVHSFCRNKHSTCLVLTQFNRNFKCLLYFLTSLNKLFQKLSLFQLLIYWKFFWSSHVCLYLLFFWKWVKFTIYILIW